MTVVLVTGTSGFIGEFLVLVGTFQVNNFVTALATLGIVLSASYALWLCRRMLFGEMVNQRLQDINDLIAREKLVFVPLILGTLFLGILPMPVFELISYSVENLVSDLATVGN